MDKAARPRGSATTGGDRRWHPLCRERSHCMVTSPVAGGGRERDRAPVALVEARFGPRPVGSAQQMDFPIFKISSKF
jgi:hypothetical protein